MAVTNSTAFRVDRLTLAELRELDENIQRAKKLAMDREKHELIRKVQFLAEQSGLNFTDIFGKIGKSAAKYINPENPSQAWTGHGRRPGWLAEKLERGSKIEDFAV